MPGQLQTRRLCSSAHFATLIVVPGQLQTGRMSSSAHFATLAVHVGSEPDPRTGAVTVPISLATTFAQPTLGVLNGLDDANSHGKGYEYSRTGNPTRGAFERALAAVERGKHGVAFASGLSATATLLHTLKTGDHVLCIDDVYGGTQRLFRQIVGPGAGVEFDFIDMSSPDSVADALTPATKMIWIETPTNPTLKVTDIRAVVSAIKSRGRDDIWVVVDNTFMSPYLQNPLTLGANIVLHSVTKYIGGHSDVVMGAVVVNDDLIWQRLKYMQNAVGSVPSPFDCYLALRGLKTLHVRMDAAMRNAMALSLFLETHEKVQAVTYPGLKSHPQHEICKSQASGFGAMITFFLKGGIAETTSFLGALKLFTLAESLGAVESLAECPAVMTHASVPPEVRKQLGISDSLVRLSIGIEHLEDLQEDLSQALGQI